MAVRQIYSIELCGRCNLKCSSCPHQHIHKHRPVEAMPDEVFSQSLVTLKAIDAEYGQRELLLNHFGDPLLQPNLPNYLDRLREALPYTHLWLVTNGIALEDRHIEAIIRNGVTVTVSQHAPAKAQEAVKRLRAAGVRRVIEDRSFEERPHGWAGPVTTRPHPAWLFKCHFLHESKAVILSNGDLTTCCMDAFGKGRFGTIWDDLEQLTPKPHDLCKTCHHRI